MPRVTLAPVTVDDDSHNGRWGGRAERNGRRLRALYLGGGKGLFDFNLVVESTDGSPLTGPFYFHLHDSFPRATYRISKVRRERYAVFEEINAYETFTAAAEVKDRRGSWVGLELDLEHVASIPFKYKPPQFRLQRAGAGREVKGRAAVLERIITNNKILKSPVVWRAAWAEAERWVCRIKLGQKVLGTGVLVGRNLVLTNWHVVERQAKAPGSALSFEFDYVYRRGGELACPFERRGRRAWLLDHGRYTEAEGAGRPSTTLPDPTELDYALIALDPADDPLGDARGYAQVPLFVSYQEGDGLIILQHPKGNPQCFAVDFQGLLGLNDNGTRLRYVTNTEDGASGSPCFDLDWQFVALHQAGVGDWPGGHHYNQGIPVVALRKPILSGLAKVG